MSISKLSLSVVATVALTGSAFAVDKDVNQYEAVDVIGGKSLDVKVTGGAKLFYQTNQVEKGGNTGAKLFEQESAIGQMAFEAGLSTEVFEGMTVNTNLIALDTLGLENDVVADIASANAWYVPSDGEYLGTQGWLAEANLNYKAAETNIVVGRQALDTPLLFTERWNASYNTFDAAVITNSDIPKTTLVGAFVGKHNGVPFPDDGQLYNGVAPSVTTHSGKFYGFGSDYNGTHVTNGTQSAYAAGAIIKPVDSLAINLWYYNVNSTVNAYWADASYKIAGVFMGVQNSGMDFDQAGADNAMLTAVKVGYGIAGFNFYGAFSTTSEGNAGTGKVNNLATNHKSKAYTQMVLHDGGAVGARDTTAWKVNGTYTIAGTKLIAQYQQKDTGWNDTTGAEFDFIAKAKLGQYFGLTAMYVHREVDAPADASDLTHDMVRLVAYTKF